MILTDLIVLALVIGCFALAIIIFLHRQDNK